MGEFDIRVQPDPHAIGRFGGQIAQFGQPRGQRLTSFRTLLVAGQAFPRPD